MIPDKVEAVFSTGCAIDYEKGILNLYFTIFSVKCILVGIPCSILFFKKEKKIQTTKGRKTDEINLPDHISGY